MVLDHETTGGGLGLVIHRQVQVKAQIVERLTDEGFSVTVKAVTASGDSADAASALTLEGAMVTVGPRPGEVAFGERRASSPLSVVDAALLSQVLVAIPAESVPSASFKLYLPTKGARVPLTLGQKLGEILRYGDAPGRSVSVTAGGSTETTISAFQASSDGSNLYVAQPALRDLIGPAPSQPFDTEVRGAAKEEPDALDTLLGGLFCGFSFGLACGSPKPRTRPKPMPGQEIVVVKGPRSLDVRLGEKIDIGVYGVADKEGRRLVQSSTTGRSILEGTLPGGAGVPPELEWKKLQVISTWRAEKTLLPADPGGRRRSLAGGLALLMLLAAALATGVIAAGQRRT